METMSQRLNELLKYYDLNLKSLFIKVYMMQGSGQQEAEEKYIKNKSNISKMMGGERLFQIKDLACIEKILNTSISYLYYGEEAYSSMPTIETAAYYDRLEDYQALGNFKEYEEDTDNSIFYNMDEFGKDIIDYIIQYSGNFKDYNGIKYLIDNNLIRLNGAYGIIHCTNSRYLEKEERELEIIKILCKMDDADYFYKTIKPDRSLYRFNENLTFKKNDEALDLILNTNNIYDFTIRKIDKINVTNKKGEDVTVIKSNPLIPGLAEYSLKHLDKYYVKARDILRYIKKFNEEQYARVLTMDCNPWLSGNEMIESSKGVLGNLVRIKVDDKIELKDEIQMLVNEINEGVSNFDNYCNGNLNSFSSGYKVDSCGNIMVAKSNNKKEFDFFELMKENNYEKTPKYLGTDNSGIYDLFAPYKGRKQDFNRAGDDNIIDLVKELKIINAISKKKLGNNNVYCHGNLRRDSVCYFNGTISTIINWEDVYIGEEWEDFIYVFINWTSVAFPFGKEDECYNMLIRMIETYEPSEEFKKGFAEKINAKADELLKKLDKNSPNYNYQFKSLYQVKAWVALYKENIDKYIG